LTCSLLAGPPAFAQATVPAPGPEATAETVEILQARKAGDLAVTVRGQGEDRVRFTLKNTGAKRLNVILPPGLVASSGVGQGFQSMGLGTPTTSPGSFGQFRQDGGNSGFRSVPVRATRVEGIAVPAGQTVDFTVPSVCLNFGIPTPTPRDQFTLMDVNEYTPDVRVQKALRSLATLGTSQGVAQAVMWHVCNGLTFDQMAVQTAKQLNRHELTLAARFVQAVDASSSSDLVDLSYLNRGRILARVEGDGLLAKDAQRLNSELAGSRLMGLPVDIVDSRDADGSSAQVGSLSLQVILTSSKPDQTQGRVIVRHSGFGGGWVDLGRVSFKADAPVGSLSGVALADTLDRAVGSAFVSAHIARRGTGTTTMKIENRLPFTVANVILKAGRSADAPSVTFTGLGIGPARSALAPIQAATGVVERVELNGL
jgi:hypothetical protein